MPTEEVIKEKIKAIQKENKDLKLRVTELEAKLNAETELKTALQTKNSMLYNDLETLKKEYTRISEYVITSTRIHYQGLLAMLKEDK